MSNTRVDERWEGAPELREKLVPIGKLIHSDNNPIIASRVANLHKALNRWGQVRPVLVEEADHGNLRIVAGHHLTEACRAKGWNHVAVIRNEFMTDEERETYRVADNLLAQRTEQDRREQMGMLDGMDLSGTGITEEDLEDSKAYHHRTTEYVPYYDLKAHPDNHKEHPQEQIEHLVRSLEENGFYRNIVCAEDGTILAGHGMWIAARRKGITRLPVTRLACGRDDPQAIKVMAADNEIGKLAHSDDRKLTEQLRKLQEGDANELIGTGHDAATLANLVLTTRPQSEIQDHDHAAEWVGMDGWEKEADRIQIIFSFEDEDAREDLMARLGLTEVMYKRGKVWSSWWPPRQRADAASVYFEEDEGQTTIDDFITEEAT